MRSYVLPSRAASGGACHLESASGSPSMNYRRSVNLSVNVLQFVRLPKFVRTRSRLHTLRLSALPFFRSLLASCLAILRYPSPAAYSFKTVSKCSVGMLLGRPGTRVVGHLDIPSMISHNRRSCLVHYRLAMVATPWRLGASPLNRMADQQPSSICRTIVEWQRPLWMVDLDA